MKKFAIATALILASTGAMANGSAEFGWNVNVPYVCGVSSPAARKTATLNNGHLTGAAHKFTITSNKPGFTTTVDVTTKGNSAMTKDFVKWGIDFGDTGGDKTRVRGGDSDNTKSFRMNSGEFSLTPYGTEWSKGKAGGSYMINGVITITCN